MKQAALFQDNKHHKITHQPEKTPASHKNVTFF